jgi:hypothetical protein
MLRHRAPARSRSAWPAWTALTGRPARSRRLPPPGCQPRDGQLVGPRVPAYTCALPMARGEGQGGQPVGTGLPKLAAVVVRLSVMDRPPYRSWRPLCRPAYTHAIARARGPLLRERASHACGGRNGGACAQSDGPRAGERDPCKHPPAAAYAGESIRQLFQHTQRPACANRNLLPRTPRLLRRHVVRPRTGELPGRRHPVEVPAGPADQHLAGLAEDRGVVVPTARAPATGGALVTLRGAIGPRAGGCCALCHAAPSWLGQA